MSSPASVPTGTTNTIRLQSTCLLVGLVTVIMNVTGGSCEPVPYGTTVGVSVYANSAG